MVEQRNSLIELLKHLDGNFKRTCPAYNNPNIGFEKLGNCTGCKYQIGKDDCDYIARATDYLLDNGVIVMPFKVGDVVYWADRKMYDKPMAVKITAFRSSKTGKNGIKWSCGCFTEFIKSDIGRTIFADIESAEKALAERNT